MRCGIDKIYQANETNYVTPKANREIEDSFYLSQWSLNYDICEDTNAALQCVTSLSSSLLDQVECLLQSDSIMTAVDHQQCSLTICKG